MEGVVIDCSVSVSWCFPDEQEPYAMQVMKAISSRSAVVPAHWHLENANALLYGERRQRSTPANTATWTAFLNSLPIETDTETASRAFGDVFNIARTHNLTIYDAAYLELAMRKGFDLATLDRNLMTAAQAAGVRRFEPTKDVRDYFSSLVPADVSMADELIRERRDEETD